MKPYHPEGIHIFVGGGSDAAIEVAGKHADTFALWGESYAQVRDVTSRVRAAAANRPADAALQPLGAADPCRTEEKAWATAEKFSRAPPRCRTRPAIANRPTAMHRRRTAAAGAADQGTRIDKRLWTEIAELTGANSNTTALVGTPEQVAEVFGDYYDLGISHS